MGGPNDYVVTQNFSWGLVYAVTNIYINSILPSSASVPTRGNMSMTKQGYQRPGCLTHDLC